MGFPSVPSPRGLTSTAELGLRLGSGFTLKRPEFLLKMRPNLGLKLAGYRPSYLICFTLTQIFFGPFSLRQADGGLGAIFFEFLIFLGIRLGFHKIRVKVWGPWVADLVVFMLFFLVSFLIPLAPSDGASMKGQGCVLSPWGFMVQGWGGSLIPELKFLAAVSTRGWGPPTQ